MARVTLHEYCEEARQLIERHAYGQAIAICRHILKRYPKHVESYRILGEACLQKGELEEATDAFKRLLSADPENFVAYAGLGVIYEEKRQLADAIWHMERAFELVPNNEEIRNALRRLYGQRDGTEPTRIKLNKVALARLYARGGQYRQAIEEFHRALEVEPERLDLKISLAETLWRDGRREQAAEATREVLKVSPYCLKAILLLGVMLIDKGRDAEGRAMLLQARSLDPENRLAQALFGERSPLPAEIVRVPRLEEKPGVEPPESISIPFTAEEPQSALPPPLETIPEPSAETQPAPGEALAPEWIANSTAAAEAAQLLATPSIEEQAVPIAAPTQEAAPSQAVEPLIIPFGAEEAAPIAAPAQEAAPEPSLAAPAAEPLTIPFIEEQAVPLAPAPEAAPAEESVSEQKAEASAVSTDEVAESVAVPPAEEVAPVPTTVVVEIEGPPVAGEPVTAEESLPAEALPVEPSVAAVSPTPVVEESAPVPAQTGADEQPPLAVRESEQASLALAIERYKQQLQQNPKDEETRLALARAYTAQEYIELALAQYKMLERAKLAILSEAIADMESIVASRPDNLSAHELLADLYARSGQLQKALDRYRWLLGQFELKTA